MLKQATLFGLFGAEGPDLPIYDYEHQSHNVRYVDISGPQIPIYDECLNFHEFNDITIEVTYFHKKRPVEANYYSFYTFL